MKRDPDTDPKELEEAVQAEQTGKPLEVPKKEASDDDEPKQAGAGFKTYPPKCRIALIVGYNGSEFFGS